MPQTLSDIKNLLAAYGLHPRYRFGQNFLHDANQMKRILAAAEIRPGDLVLEVGPGTGALSEWLLEAGARLVAVEIDLNLEPILRQRLVERYPGRVTLLMADVLAGKHQINPQVFTALGGRGWETLEPSPGGRGGKALEPSPFKRGSFKLVANLPYNVASPLLANLMLDHPEMSLAVVMIQREVADRLIAPPGGKEYGPLGVLAQAICQVERVARLSPSCFWPQPKVESAVVQLRRRPTPLAQDPHALSRTLQILFGKRRKQIGAILGRDHPLPPGVAATARPEQLSVEQIIALSNLIS